MIVLDLPAYKQTSYIYQQYSLNFKISYLFSIRMILVIIL